jgi:hypothetical protein
MTTFDRHDTIRLNRLGAETETVLDATEAFVETYEGNRYHPTKVVLVAKAGR